METCHVLSTALMTGELHNYPADTAQLPREHQVAKSWMAAPQDGWIWTSIICLCVLFFVMTFFTIFSAGSNGPQKFCIEKVGKDTWLPRSHTWWVFTKLLLIWKLTFVNNGIISFILFNKKQKKMFLDTGFNKFRNYNQRIKMFCLSLNKIGL